MLRVTKVNKIVKRLVHEPLTENFSSQLHTSRKQQETSSMDKARAKFLRISLLVFDVQLIVSIDETKAISETFKV